MHLLVLPGDDIGPEITTAARTVLVAADEVYALGLEFEQQAIGMAAWQASGTTVPREALQAALAADGVLLGPCGMTAYPPLNEGGVNVPGTIRKRLDLYANIRPALTREAVPDSRPGLDLVIVRENTEGFYADRTMYKGIGEFMPTEDVALSIRKITRPACRRIAEVAFTYARRRRGKVTAVGKRHVLQVTDGVFIEEAEAVASANPEVTFEEMDIDAAAAEFYTAPGRFDVILITNMFGDILSNLAVALSGSLGLAAALNAGAGHAVANAGHGSAPGLAGRNTANPSGMILSSAMLLDWLGERHGKTAFKEAANAIARSVSLNLQNPAVRTGDVGGKGTTEGFAAAVADTLRSGYSAAAR